MSGHDPVPSLICFYHFFRDSILKSIEKKLNSSDLNDYDLLVAASIYFNEQVTSFAKSIKLIFNREKL